MLVLKDTFSSANLLLWGRGVSSSQYLILFILIMEGTIICFLYNTMLNIWVSELRSPCGLIHLYMVLQCLDLHGMLISSSFFKKRVIPTSFYSFSSFLLSVNSNKSFNKSCRWLDSNLGLLVLEATELPIVAHPLPKSVVV